MPTYHVDNIRSIFPHCSTSLQHAVGTSSTAAAQRTSLRGTPTRTCRVAAARCHITIGYGQEAAWPRLLPDGTFLGYVGCIPADTLEQIFELLCTTKPGGTGLGLYIVQEIVTAHRGHITGESPAGRGTTFTSVLPRARHDAGPA